MIWHIFKKDWKLLWPFVAMLAGAYVLNTLMWLGGYGHFGQPRALEPIPELFPGVVFIGIGLITIATLHQDAIPGDRQDWLVRPIRRHHLMLGKLLFITLGVLGPLFAIDVATILMTGFSAADALGRSLARAAALLCLICLPAAGVAAVSRNLTQALVIAGVAVVTIFALIYLFYVGNELGLPVPSPSFLPSALYPMTWFAHAAVVVVGVAAIFGLQFARRRTGLSRAVLAVTILVALACEFLPWKPVYAIHTWLLPARDTAGVQVVFEPAGQKGYAMWRPPNLNRVPEIALPLRIADLPTASALHADRVEVSLIGADGAILHQRAYFNEPFDGGLPSVRHDAGEAAHTRQRLTFSPTEYARLKDELVRIEISYRFTLFAADPTDTLAALGEDTTFAAGNGWCKTKLGRNVRPGGDAEDVVVACMSAKARPDCRRMFLENPTNGQRNPESFGCNPQYAPFNARLYPTVLDSYRTEIKFSDRQGLRKFPVDETQIQNARVQMTGYRPVATLTRQIVIPDIRLRDWELEPDPNPPTQPMRMEMVPILP